MAVLFMEFRRSSVLVLGTVSHLEVRSPPGAVVMAHKPRVAGGPGGGHDPGDGTVGVMQLDLRASLHFHLGPAGEY